MRDVLRTAALAAVAALVAFHGWLFAGQVAAGRLDDPWLVLRWIAAAALLAALVNVRRGGESIWGRRGIAVWVLAALLHGPAVAANSSDGIDSLALPEAVATSILQLVATTAIGAGLWILAALLSRRRRQTSPILALALVFSAAGILADGFTPPYASRPPPQNS